MKKRFPKVGVWVVNTFLLAALVMVISSMMRGQTVRATKVDDLGHFAGKTQCDSLGRIEILISRKVPPEGLSEVLTHEAVHVLQIRSFGQCTEALERFTHDREFALKQETEAYCVEYQLFAGNRNQFLAFQDRLTAFLWVTGMKGNFSSYEALKAYVVSVCRTPSPNVPDIKFISAVGAVATFEISHKETAHAPP